MINGHTLYKTGDLVSLANNGETLFHGRIDSQVKIRGYRIELSEIESILRDMPNIANAVVSVTEKNKMTVVKPLSLVMKGENLSGKSVWEGVPCQKANNM